MSRKSMSCKIFGLSVAVMLALFVFCLGVNAVAQTPTDASYGESEAVDADALVCWWKTDKSSIRIGEEFTVTLTCRSVETDREKTVLNDSLLDPGAISLSPYQVKSGRRYKEINRILSGPDGPVTLRNVQYTYTVKLIGEGFFGMDVPLPPLEIRYHIDLVTNKDVVTPGKERTYILSPLPMRIQSLVPKTADTIRDAGTGTFGDIESRRKNAIIAFVAAGTFLLLPLVVMFPILVRAVRGRRENISNGTVFRDKDLLRRLARELDLVEKNCRTASWDKASVGTALSVFRVAGALAVARRVAQVPVGVETRGFEGQLELRKGFWTRTKVLVSASLTPEEMADKLTGENWQEVAKASRKALLYEAQTAFAAFNDARYATTENAADRATLDGALKTGLRLLRELRLDRCPAIRMAREVAGRCTRWRRQWKRS